MSPYRAWIGRFTPGFTPEETVTFFKDGIQGETLDRIVLNTKDWAPRRMPNGTQTMPYNDESSNAPHSYAMTPDARAAAWETGPFEGEKEGTKWLTVWRWVLPKARRAFA